jgi:hypothetical protein
MTLKYTNIIPTYIPRPSKIYSNWDFWYENTPSGDTGEMVELRSAKKTDVGKINEDYACFNKTYVCRT